MIAHRLRDAALTAWSTLPAPAPDATSDEILLIRPDHLGDVLFLLPALERFRAALPGALVTLAIGPWSRPIAEGQAAADRIVTVPFPGFTRRDAASPVAPYQALRDWARELREQAPAAAVILRDDHWWAALAAQRAGIPLRVGADHPAVRRSLTHAVPLAAGHWVQRNAALLDRTATLLGGTPPETPVTPATTPLRWQIAPDADAAATRLLAEARVSRPFAVIHPGSGAQVKLWPAARWAAVADALAHDAGLAIVLTGSEGEAPLVDAVQRAMRTPAASLAGRTDIPGLAALFARARLVSGVDSGPLHLAVAVGTPTVHLYGPSSVADYGPWGDPVRHRALHAGMRCPRCGDLSPERPAGAGCMLALRPEEVIAAAHEVLAHA